MVTNKISVKIAGPAGEGVISAGQVFAKSCLRGGLYVVTENERPSLIRGGHNEFMIRAEDEQIYSHINMFNIVIALDEQSITQHLNELSHQGAIIYDGESHKISPEELGRDDVLLIPVPMHSIIKEAGAGKIVENALAVGACFGLLDYDMTILNDILTEMYRKHPEALEADLKVAQAGYDFVQQHKQTNNLTFTNTLAPITDAPKRMLLNGITAFDLGALKAGVSFLSQYPMTPSTGVLQGLIPYAESHKIAIVQTEDEISSINMAIGASLAGVRSLTASSGGGYALMNEGLSLAGMTETSVVIAEVMRGGPATGLPTRTEQSDLQFVLNSGHGEFPHVVIAPSTPQSCFVEAQRAFNLADKYQLPVTVLMDRHNAETFHAIEELPEPLPIERREYYTHEEIDATETPNRFSFSDSGVSKRFNPGTKNARFVSTGNERDEYGLINDVRETRVKMVDKRQKKLAGVLAELPQPTLNGSPDADVTFISFGSTWSIIQDARTFLEREGKTTAHLHLTYMQPFQTKEIETILQTIKNPVIVENNATGQLGQLIRQHTGILIDKKLLQYDGWPFSPEDIMRRVLEQQWN